MLTIDHTCIKKGNYNVTPEEKPDTVNPEIDTPDPEFPVEIDYPDYDQDYGVLASVDSEIDNEEDEDEWELDESGRYYVNTETGEHYYPDLDDPDYDENDLENGWFPPCPDSSEHLDFDSIIHQVKVDIATRNFLPKARYYQNLLKVDDLDQFYTIEENSWNVDLKVDEILIFERLFELYCPDTGFVISPRTNHHLREYLDKLDKDGRLIVKSQLNLFGEV